MSVETIIKSVVAIQRTIPGIVKAFENAPEALDQLPCFVTYPDTFQVDRVGSNIKSITYDLKMTLFVNRGGDLSSADAMLKPYIKTVIDIFDQNIQLGGSAWDSMVKSGRYGTILYGGVDFLGIDFVLEAQERNTVVFH